MMERIEAAAIKLETGIVVRLPRPGRHHDVIRHAVAIGHTPDDIAGGIQGFWTNRFQFVGRQEAAAIAEAAGQRLRITSHKNLLFSEDLW